MNNDDYTIPPSIADNQYDKLIIPTKNKIVKMVTQGQETCASFRASFTFMC